MSATGRIWKLGSCVAGLLSAVSVPGFISEHLDNGDSTLRRCGLKWVSQITCYKSPTVLEDIELSFRPQPHFLHVLPSPLVYSFLQFTFITTPSPRTVHN